MWALLSTKTQILIISLICLLTLEAIRAFNECFSEAPLSIYQIVSIVVWSISSLATFFLNSIWRQIWEKYPILNTYIFPDINGTWEGSLTSSWINPKTGKKNTPIPVSFTIRQNLFSCSIQMTTKESKSFSSRCFAEANRLHKTFRVWYSYDNQPKASVMSQSPKHEGIACLDIHVNTAPHGITGKYFTERLSSGDIQLKKTL